MSREITHIPEQKLNELIPYEPQYPELSIFSDENLENLSRVAYYISMHSLNERLKQMAINLGYNPKLLPPKSQTNGYTRYDTFTGLPL